MVMHDRALLVSVRLGRRRAAACLVVVVLTHARCVTTSSFVQPLKLSQSDKEKRITHQLRSAVVLNNDAYTQEAQPQVAQWWDARSPKSCLLIPTPLENFNYSRYL